MSSVDFTLPGCCGSDDALAKITLARTFAHSKTHNPRNVEHPWYAYWDCVLNSLTSDNNRLVVAPQHLLYFETSAEGVTDPVPTGIEGPPGHKKNASVSTVAASEAREVIPDFAIIRYQKPPIPENADEAGKDVPLLMEIKRAGPRKFCKEATYVNMTLAQRAAEKQAWFLFQMDPNQETVILIGCVGAYWTCRLMSRDQAKESKEDGRFLVDLGGDNDYQMESDEESSLGSGSDEGIREMSPSTEESEPNFYQQVMDSDLELMMQWTGIMELDSEASNQHLFLIHQYLNDG